MLTVRLHGHLEEKFGSEFHFYASSIREVIDALQANFDDFTEEFIKDQRAYNILIDFEAQEMVGCFMPLKSDSTIDIVPIVGGAGNIFKTIGMIIVAAILIIQPQFLLAALPAFFSTTAGGYILSTIGFSLLMAGVSSLLAGPDGPDGGGPESSTLNQTDNIVGQGMPVPIGYGRMMLGSVVLSATSTSSYIKTSKAYTYNNTQSGYWADTNTGVPSEVFRPLEAFTGEDGYVYSALNIDPLSIEEWQQRIENRERTLGSTTYELRNFTDAAGNTRAVATFVPLNYNGVYE